MKHIDYLYFNIYSYCYRLSQYRSSANTRLQTMYLFSLGSGGWLLFLEALYLHFIKHTRFASRDQSAIFALSVYLFSALLFNYIFITKDRDMRIIGKYEALLERQPNRKLHLILSAGVLMLPYLGLFSLAIFFPRHGQ